MYLTEPYVKPLTILELIDNKYSYILRGRFILDRAELSFATRFQKRGGRADLIANLRDLADAIEKDELTDKKETKWEK